MTNRQAVYVYDEDGAAEYDGWFDADAATSWPEATRFDGRNYVSRATGTEWDHETLYRTSRGRWVVNWFSQWQGTPERWRFVDEATAFAWLAENNHDDVAEQFGAEDERGPGRPEVGPQIKTRLPGDVLARVDAAAAAAGGLSRSAWIRRAVESALD